MSVYQRITGLTRPNLVERPWTDNGKANLQVLPTPLRQQGLLAALQPFIGIKQEGYKQQQGHFLHSGKRFYKYGKSRLLMAT